MSPHAKEKPKRLKQIGVPEEKVRLTVRNPEILVPDYFERKVAQLSLSDALVLRVVYEETDNSLLVVTMYPAKKGRYA